MRRAVLLGLLAVTLVTAVSDAEYRSEFTAFVKKYNKQYTTEQLFERFDAFKANYDFVLKHNAKQPTPTFTVGINELSDSTPAERAARAARGASVARTLALSRRASAAHSAATTTQIKHRAVRDVPAEVDWRKQGAVTPVQNQGQCGSSPHFATVAAIEGYHFIRTGKLLKLSEQQLVDCPTVDNNGCNGANYDGMLDYVVANGSCLESAYPYQSSQGQYYPCRDKGKERVAFINGWSFVGNNESQVQLGVAEGPVITAVDASSQEFESYTGGVFQTTGSIQPNHGISIVGYGTDSSTNQPYWILKNTWGASWGEQGYMRILRGVDMCGINDYATVVV